MVDSEWHAQINALMFRIQQKDKAALNVLYGQASGKLLGIIYRIVSDHAEAEDVLQNVFIKLWQQAHQYSGKGTAWAWLCVMARHSALDRLRQLQAHPHISSDDEPVLDTLVSEFQGEDQHAVNTCLSQLKQSMRESVVLACVYGYSHRELSDKLASPLGTVKAWVRRGLQELKQCLQA